MKTTINIPEGLFEEARKLAQKERTTLRSLVEEGLRRAIADHKRSGAFRLRKATFKGKGVRGDLEGASWAGIRERLYEGRGG
ncbi:MAG: type II toxin-antitoxin system VapB family antitoxin [Candidatus Sumerlaeota bacterium]|nr:type II toxin-antitoxin system VapB family antitoxin [Candidatus Sumerlaeota bacterium]